MSTLHSQELTSDTATLLLLHFNNNTDGADMEVPIEATNLSYQAGMLGSAIEISNTTTLKFDTTQNIDPRKGSVEFWLKPTTWGTVLDMGVGGGLSVQIGDWTRMIFNIYGLNGNPEIGVLSPRDANQWSLGQWSHFVFTWGDGNLMFYINGQLKAESAYNFDLPPVDLGFFSIGSKFDGFEHFEGLIDELRISNRVRSAQEVFNSYFQGLNLNLTTFGARSLDTIKMYETWNVYLQRSGFWKVPELYLTNGSDTVNLSNQVVVWSVSDTSIIKITSEGMTAYKAGNASLIATFSEMTVTIPVQVKKAIKAPTYESNIDNFLTTPAGGAHDTMPVLVIVYIPTLDSVNIDLVETQDGLPIPAQTVAFAKAHILGISRHTKFTLEEGSKFRGYNNPGALPYLGYKVVDYITVFEGVPRGFPVPGNSGFFTDFNQIISRFNGKHYVEDLGVKEIWIYGIHSNEVVVVESNMASPTTGDISNSYRHPDDLPIYDKTYIAYNYNITRSGNEAVHNHGHQLEAMCSYVAQNQDGNTDLFWKEFVGWNSGKFPVLRAGDTHHPPNTLMDYDYENSTSVLTDIMDWSPAGGTGTVVNKDTWGNIPYNWPSANLPEAYYPPGMPSIESNWYLFWMQSFPGYGNNIPYENGYMTNWWRFVSDWDQNHGIGLHQDTVAQNRSLHFDGIDDVVVGPSSALLEISTGSVELWIKPESKPTSQTFLCYRDNTGSQTRYLWNLLGNLDGLGFLNGLGYVTFNYSFSSGVWYHLAFLGGVDETHIYINGIKVGAFPLPFGTATGDDLHLVLGHDIPFSEFYEGEIDELRIWNRPLCEGEIAAHRSCYIDETASGLIAYYSFDQGIAGDLNTDSTVLMDKTANGLNGLLTNFTLDGNMSNWLSSTNGVNDTCGEIICPPANSFKVVTKAVLGGAYFPVGDTMSTSLRAQNFIPSKCPYDTAMLLNTIPENMVDWLKIDLVDTLTGDTIYDSQCACLINNGQIQNTAGDTTFNFSLESSPFYSLRIKHRNHLSVRSRGIPVVPGSSVTVDFRSGTNLYIDPSITGGAYHNIGMPEVLIPSLGSHPSRYALWPGDANGDGQVKYQGSGNDRGMILSAIGGTNITNTVTGYLPTDLTLNGQIKYQGSGNDRGIVLSSIGGSVITKVSKAHD